ncbi:MAG: AAA family ATPase [Gemmataceae bacterium]|nr:AAA family ATPase [Gemmataceae bacterium]
MATAPEKGLAATTNERTNPPFLRRVRIRGYKSIAFCDVTLEPLTILVGRNASGKSNFLDALAFLRDMLEDGINSAALSHGGESVFTRRSKTNTVSFEVEADFPGYQMECRALYRVRVSLTPRKQLEVEHEELRIDDLTHGKGCGFTATRGQIAWEGLEDFRGGEGFTRAPNVGNPTVGGSRQYPYFFDQYRPDRLLLGVIGSQPFISLAEGIRSIGCFNFHPDSIRKLGKSVGSPALERDGGNLARAIEGLKEIDADTLTRIGAYLTTIVPEIDAFEVIQYGEYETVRFRMRSLSDKSSLVLDAASMSDGTLRVLAALVAAFQIHLPIGPSIIAIEEPETSLHPAAMRALVDALDEATLRTQVLLTTHSADMLDNPTVRPENVRVVELVDGQTVIGPVDEASVEIVRKKLDTLGGLERQNQLEPNPDDLERQRHLSQNGQEPKG